MARRTGTPTNSGGTRTFCPEIRVENVNDDPEINSMALKIRESSQKNASSLRQQGKAGPNIFITNDGTVFPIKYVVMPSPNPSQKVIQEKLMCLKNFKNITGKYGWITIGSHSILYLIRIINGKPIKFVSLRMVEKQLFRKYLQYLHADVYNTCTSIRGHLITEDEAKLLNEINQDHNDQIYGEELFIAGKDFTIRLEDALAFYVFLEFCFKRLQIGFTFGSNEKCGFIRIGSHVLIPYCIKDDKKYVPLFYFHGEIDNLRQDAIKLKNWDLAYLKFCFKVQNIKDKFFNKNSCIVISFDAVKRMHPPNTKFEEYWPENDDYQQRLINQTRCVKPFGFCLKKPCAVLNKAFVPENIVPHPALCPSQSAIPPPSMSMNTSLNQSRLPSNQKNLAVLEQNSSGNPINIQSSRFVRIKNPMTQIVRIDPVSYSNVSSTSKSTTTMYSPMTNDGNVILLNANHKRQFFSDRRSVSNSQPQQKLLEKQKRPKQMLQQKLHENQQKCQKEEQQQQEQKKLQVEQQISQQKMLQQPRSASNIQQQQMLLEKQKMVQQEQQKRQKEEEQKKLQLEKQMFKEKQQKLQQKQKMLQQEQKILQQKQKILQQKQQKLRNVIQEKLQLKKKYQKEQRKKQQRKTQQQKKQQQKKLQQQHKAFSALVQQEQQHDRGSPIMNEGVVCSSSQITSTQHSTALGLGVNDQASEIINLTSPSSSLGLLSVQPPDSISCAGTSYDLTRIAENQVIDQFVPAYQIQKVPLLGKMIQCINAEAFGKLPMVTLDDLVQTMFPSSTVASCAEVLTKDLNLTLYRGNSEQITMLRVAGRIKSNNTDETPMALLKDIIPVIPKLKDLLRKHNEQMLYLSREDEPVKRQHTSYK